MTNHQEISVEQLRHVTGGAQQQQAPLPIRPVPMPDMGGPKYSAAWWELVRKSGNMK